MVKQGYKQTEVGEIPEDWDLVNLGEIGKVSSCKRIMKYQTSSLGDIPFYKIGTFGKEADAYISKEIYNEYRQKYTFPKKGEILISASGTIGRTVIYEGSPAYFQDSNIIWIENNESIVKNIFMFYYYKIIKWTTEDTTISRLYNDNLKKLLIPVPPKNEQEKIALVLFDTDALIEQLNKLIEKKKNIKQGAMQELLTGKKRLLGFKGEWEEEEIGHFFSLFSGKTKSQFIEEDGKYIIMDMGSVSSDGKNISNKFTNIAVDFLEIGELVMPKDDIGGGNIIAKTVHINANNKYVLGDHVYKLKIKDNSLNSLFFSYLINSYTVNSHLRKKVSGSAQLGINRRSIEEQKVFVPKDPKEQSAIAQVLSDIDADIQELERKRDKYQLIKTGMMQQLLTGKIRLPWKN